MVDAGLAGCEFIAVNTDAQALMMTDADVKIQVGAQVTRGLGAGADPEIGFAAAQESRDELKEALKGPGTVVAYKFGRQAQEVAEALRESGRIGDAVWGSALGLAEESIRPAADLDGEPLPYLSTLIAPAPRDGGRGGKL